MKRVVFYFALIFVALLGEACQSADRVVPFDQLPESAQSFIKTHFPDLSVSVVIQEHRSYEVRLADGSEVEFDRSGDWDNVDCAPHAVPQTIVSLLPAAIPTYIATSFPNDHVVSIDKNRRNFEIELSNDLDLKFSKEGKFLALDD